MSAPTKCACQRLAAAGWRVRCAACGADTLTAEEVVCIGWDGRSNPIRRYRADLPLADHLRRSVVAR